MGQILPTKALLSVQMGIIRSPIAVLGRVCANTAPLGMESGQDTVKVVVHVVRIY